MLLCKQTKILVFKTTFIPNYIGPGKKSYCPPAPVSNLLAEVLQAIPIITCNTRCMWRISAFAIALICPKTEKLLIRVVILSTTVLPTLG